MKKTRGRKRQGFPVFWLVGILVIGIALGTVFWRKAQEGRKMAEADVVIKTNKGDIALKIYPDLAPITVGNFVDLIKSGFYDGLIWHRVEDWVVQTGDPLGTGYGGSDKTIELEIAEGLSNTRGSVGMARSQDPNSASSQFYILKKDALSLDGGYAIFAEVVAGMDVVDRLQIGDEMLKVTLNESQKD